VLLCLLALSCSVDAEVFKGMVSSKSGFQFLGKFCFDNMKGDDTLAGSFDLELTTRNPNTSQSLRVLMYTDEENSWPSVYHHGELTCQQKVERAKRTNSIIEWDDGHYNNRFVMTQKTRPRFWVVVLANCQEAGFRDVKYNLHFRNILHSNWQQEFGMNVMGLQTFYLVLCILWVPFMAAVAYSIVKLRQKMSFVHPLVRVFGVVLVCEWFAMTCMAIHYVSFTGNGQGLPELLRVAQVVDVMSRVGFIGLMILMAQGWCISSDHIESRSVLVVVPVFFILYMALLVWEHSLVDSAQITLPTSASVMLWMVVAVWFLFAAWFVFTIFKSYRAERNPAKKSLYAKIGVIYTPWFLALPLISVMATALDNWVRDKYVDGAAELADSGAYLAMAVLLWHSRAQNYFQMALPQDRNYAKALQYEQL